MPPKGFRKQSTTATPQLLSAALSIVRVLLESSPKSMNLAMAETCLKQEEASLGVISKEGARRLLEAWDAPAPAEPAPAAPIDG